MKKEHHKTEHFGQRQHHLLQKQVIIRAEKSPPIPARPGIKNSHLIDRLKGTFLGDYREIFDAWNHAESKIFTYMEATYDWLRCSIKNNKRAPLLIQLIPIDPKGENEFIDVRY